MKRAAFWAVASLSILLFAASVSFARMDVFARGTSNEFVIKFVPISGVTNPTEAQANAGNLDGFGIVEYDYRMGAYEITNSQWNKFKAELGVPVTGSPPSAYDQEFRDFGPASGGAPSNRVSWYEAAQFVNWLNTSTGHHAAYNFTGTQGQSDYTFTTWDASEAWGGTNLYRHEDAYYFLPDENEWLKAAFWNGTAIQNRPTRPGDTWPRGDRSSGAGWNCYLVGSFPQYNGPWNVGSGSEELNGTYDMIGNLAEWVENPRNDGDYSTDSRHVLRGGYYAWNSYYLTPSDRGNSSHPATESCDIGFRVASVPEPGGLVLLAGIVLTMLLRRGRKHT